MLLPSVSSYLSVLNRSLALAVAPDKSVTIATSKTSTFLFKANSLIRASFFLVDVKELFLIISSTGFKSLQLKPSDS